MLNITILIKQRESMLLFVYKYLYWSSAQS